MTPYGVVSEQLSPAHWAERAELVNAVSKLMDDLHEGKRLAQRIEIDCEQPTALMKLAEAVSPRAPTMQLSLGTQTTLQGNPNLTSMNTPLGAIRRMAALGWHASALRALAFDTKAARS